MKTRFFILRKDEQFNGSCVNCVLNVNGRAVIPYQQLSFRDYMTAHADVIELVSNAKFDQMLTAYYESRRTAPREIAPEDYEWLLECLPPCKWNRGAHFSSFHMSERITGNLVTWCGHYHDKYWRLDDYDTAKHSDLFEQVSAFFSCPVLSVRYLSQGGNYFFNVLNRNTVIFKGAGYYEEMQKVISEYENQFNTKAELKTVTKV